MSLWCWSNTNAVHTACVPSGCVHMQNKPLHLYLDGDQRASNIGSACLGLCPWSVPPALFWLLDLSWRREAGAPWLCQWPSCSLASPKAQQWGSCWGNELLCHTLVHFFLHWARTFFPPGKPKSRSSHFTCPTACSAGNRPWPWALVPAAGKGPQGSGGRWRATSLGAARSCL